MGKSYEPETSTRAQIDATAGPLVLEFGTNWCGYCQGAQPVIDAAFASYPAIPHLKIEDGKGRPLGRSFRVKLWPTLIFLREGAEVARVVRPTDAQSIADALAQLAL
jgi:thioredoxin 1